MIREEIDVQINDEIFWTDSQIVLGYINSYVQCSIESLWLIEFNK